MTSFSGKTWQLAPDVVRIEKAIEILLKNRKLETYDVIRNFLNPRLHDCHDPFEMFGMEKSINRILRAIENGERIMIFGDFDTDGIASTVILVDALRTLGAKISYRIPDRNRDSHGLKKYFIDEIATKNVKLIITCDCGINDAEEVSHAANLGIDVIVTDHHEPCESQFPIDATAVLNPKMQLCEYPEKNLSGSAIAFKLISAIGSVVFEKSQKKLQNFCEKYLEIAAIGIIADCVKLTGENRVLVKFGLKKLQKTSWKPLQKMLARERIDPKNVDTETIGFFIAPRLNAASRIGDVLVASELFLASDNCHERRIDQLEKWNEIRRERTESAVRESRDQVRPNAPFQFFCNKNWIPGILGLIGGRFCEEFDTPIVVATIRDDGLLAASCRAPDGFSMINALRSCPSNLFISFGGHEGAAGFLAEPWNFQKIRDCLDDHFSKFNRLDPKIKIEMFLSHEICNEKSEELCDFLKNLAPMGEGNQNPIFAVRNAKILDFSVIGKNKNHAKITVEIGKKQFDFVNFFHGDFCEKIRTGMEIDLAFTISENFFKKRRRIQFRIVDARQNLEFR